MNEYRPVPGNADPAALPKISNAVLKRFLKRPPNFESLYRRLRTTNPGAAEWLLSVTEGIAPANTSEKEKYATVALQLYNMLLEQHDINELSARLGANYHITGPSESSKHVDSRDKKSSQEDVAHDCVDEQG
jgi:hypothetical protein